MVRWTSRTSSVVSTDGRSGGCSFLRLSRTLTLPGWSFPSTFTSTHQSPRGRPSVSLSGPPRHRPEASSGSTPLGWSNAVGRTSRRGEAGVSVDAGNEKVTVVPPVEVVRHGEDTGPTLDVDEVAKEVGIVPEEGRVHASSRGRWGSPVSRDRPCKRPSPTRVNVPPPSPTPPSCRIRSCPLLGRMDYCNEYHVLLTWGCLGPRHPDEMQSMSTCRIVSQDTCDTVIRESNRG